MATQKFDIKMCRSSVASEDLFIGSFGENAFDLSGAQGPILMQYLDENITEDVDVSGGVEKGSSEYYARRKKRRYKNKTVLVIEEQGRRSRLGSGIKLNGTMVDASTEGATKPKYALFEMNNIGGTVEINMIPVDTRFSFKKPSRSADMSLDDLELAFEQTQRLKAQANKKFSRVMKAMEQKSVEFSEKTGLDHFKGKRPEGEGSSDVAFGAPLFGPEAMKALKSSGQRSFENKSFKGYMDESGGAVATENDNDMECDAAGDADQGDFREHWDDVDFDDKCSDDDDYVGTLQKIDDEREEAELAKETDVAGDVPDSADEEDDSGADSETESRADADGVVNQSEELMRSARELRFMEKQKERRVQRQQNIEDMEVETEIKGDAAPLSKRRKISTDAHSTETGIRGVENNFDFNEQGMRQFIAVVGGGQATVKAILQQFRKQMKAFGSTAGERLKEILKNSSFSIVEDPMRGKTVILK